VQQLGVLGVPLVEVPLHLDMAELVVVHLEAVSSLSQQAPL